MLATKFGGTFAGRNESCEGAGSTDEVVDRGLPEIQHSCEAGMATHESDLETEKLQESNCDLPGSACDAGGGIGTFGGCVTNNWSFAVASQTPPSANLGGGSQEFGNISDGFIEVTTGKGGDESSLDDRKRHDCSADEGNQSGLDGRKRYFAVPHSELISDDIEEEELEAYVTALHEEAQALALIANGQRTLKEARDAQSRTP